MLQMISGLFGERNFFVRDCGYFSKPRPQNSGISQGCTLSPLLFEMVMSVLLQEAVCLLGPGARRAYDQGDFADVVYADDTLLMGGDDQHLNEYLHAVATAGGKYGMELHWGKFQVLAIQCSPRISATDGSELPVKSRMGYLGTIMSVDVHDSHEPPGELVSPRAIFSRCPAYGNIQPYR